MKFPIASRKEVLNRGTAPESFLTTMVEVFRTLRGHEMFLPDNENDVFGKAASVLGPYTSIEHRMAVMLECMRVLALFESSCDWTEGVDTSRLGPDTPENAEAGAWQVSYDSRRLHPSLNKMLMDKGIVNGIQFQQVMKFEKEFAVKYAALLMSHNGMHNGPLYKGAERAIIRKSLRDPKHSIYPWLDRDAVAEFLSYLT